MKVKTRFAPSPTGYLHVGGARTALFSYLVARHAEGEFVLRVEDTDLERSTPEAVEAILEGMAWLGLNADEAPTFQTKRFDRYREVAQQLLGEGKAYRCACSKERLSELREAQMANKQKPRYDGHCRDQGVDDDVAHVIRFKTPLEGSVVFEDAISGRIEVQNSELDDLIIARTDGTPTYNFTVVVDDADMEITHVVRGSDHINNTPRQINIFNALGRLVPQYAHVPMILGSDGKKLSKRHGAVSVMQYRDDGYLPEALLNYLVRLGWAHGDQEIFSREEMIALFDVKAASKSAAAFNHEKLQWLNQHYMKSLDREYVASALVYHFEQMKVNYDEALLPSIVEAFADRTKTLKEMAEVSQFCFSDVTYDEKAKAKFLIPEAASVLQEALARLSALECWEQTVIHGVVKALVADLGLKFPKVAQPLRVALTGNTVSPGIDQTLILVGRETSLARIQAAIEVCS